MNANHEQNMKRFRDWWHERVDTCWEPGQGLRSPTEGVVRGIGYLPEIADWPRLDVIENDDVYLVSAELPGVDIDNVSLLVGPYDVVVRGERPADTSKGRRIILEQPNGEFSRKLTFDNEVVGEAASATLSHGILYISLPKAGSAANDRFEVDINVA